jgi:hypothetical protein
LCSSPRRHWTTGKEGCQPYRKHARPLSVRLLKRSTVLQRPGSAMDLGGCVFKMRYLVTGDSGFNGSNRRRGCARRGERFGLRDPSCGANFSPALGGPAARNESSQYRWHAQRTNCRARRWLGACCVRGVVCSVWRNPGPAESGTMPAEPISPYGVSKYVGELNARVFTKTYGLETACIRHFNVFGPRQGPSSQYSGLLSRFMLGARRRRSRRKKKQKKVTMAFEAIRCPDMYGTDSTQCIRKRSKTDTCANRHLQPRCD